MAICWSVKVSWANSLGILEGVIAAALPGAAGVVGPCSFLGGDSK